jgi:hypothetical protein
VPYSCDASFASIVANDSGTMRFSAATIDVSADEPHELKTFEDITLTTGKEFLVNVTENSEGIAVSDIQLLLVEDGEVIGEVAEDGTETIY